MVRRTGYVEWHIVAPYDARIGLFCITEKGYLIRTPKRRFDAVPDGRGARFVACPEILKDGSVRRTSAKVVATGDSFSRGKEIAEMINHGYVPPYGGITWRRLFR